MKLNKINWFVAYMLCICRFKNLGSLTYKGDATEFFKK